MSNRFFIIIGLFLLLAGCNSNHIAPGQSCIDPYNFGYPQVKLSANGQNVSGNSTTGEYSQWTDTGTVFNGMNIDFMIDSYPYWVPYYGSAGAPLPPQNASMVNCHMIQEGSKKFTFVYNTEQLPNSLPDSDSNWCQWCSSYDKNNRCTAKSTCSGPDCPQFNNAIDVVNFPFCAMSYGLGAYVLFTPPTSLGSAPINPNSSAAAIKDPSSPLVGGTTFHLFSANNPSSNTPANCPGSAPGKKFTPGGNCTGLFNGELSPNPGSQYSGGEIYMKILDNQYEDNSGGYNIRFRSGTTKIGGPFSTVGNLYQSIMNNISENLFTHIVTDYRFISLVRAILILYVIINGIMFTLGMVQISQKELASRLLKFGIIATLLTGQSAWTFFNDYFFQIFTGGVGEVVSWATSMITGNLGSRSGSAAVFVFFDQLMDIFFSRETNAKILSLLPIWVGFYMIPIIYFGIGFFAIMVCQTFIHYLTALLTINFLIILSPIFISFMLFNVTKPLFESWLSNLVSYTIQPILYMIALLIVALMIINEFQKLLGYGICWKTVISVLGLDVWSFYEPWSADQMGNTMAPIRVPNYGYSDSDGNICQPYSCIQVRNIYLPFLDPLIDGALLDVLVAGNYGEKEHFGETLIFIMLIFFSSKFLPLIPSAARAIAGTPTQLAKLESVSQGTIANLAGTISGVGGVAKRVANNRVTRFVGGQINQRALKPLGAKLKIALDKISKINKDDSTLKKALKFIPAVTRALVSYTATATKLVTTAAKDVLLEEALGTANYDSKLSSRVGKFLIARSEWLKQQASGAAEALSQTNTAKKISNKWNNFKKTKTGKILSFAGKGLKFLYTGGLGIKGAASLVTGIGRDEMLEKKAIKAIDFTKKNLGNIYGIASGAKLTKFIAGKVIPKKYQEKFAAAKEKVGAFASRVKNSKAAKGLGMIYRAGKKASGKMTGAFHYLNDRGFLTGGILSHAYKSAKENIRGDEYRGESNGIGKKMLHSLQDSLFGAGLNGAANANDYLKILTKKQEDGNELSYSEKKHLAILQEPLREDYNRYSRQERLFNNKDVSFSDFMDAKGHEYNLNKYLQDMTYEYGADAIPAALYNRFGTVSGSTYDYSADKFMAEVESGKVLSRYELEAADSLREIRKQDTNQTFLKADGSYDYNSALQDRLLNEGVDARSDFIVQLAGSPGTLKVDKS